MPRAKNQTTAGSAPERLEEDELGEAIARCCESDDAEALRALLEEQEVNVACEISHSRYAIEYAYEADAPECFAAIDQIAREQGSKKGALGQRLWGGQTAALRCCCHTDSMERGHSAPKCLAWVLEREPLVAFSMDEEKRSGLDWAAMSDNPAAYELLLDSLERALAAKTAKPKEARQALSKSAFYAVSTASDPARCLALLESLSRFGIDWRELRSNKIDWLGERKPGEGQSLLGAALDSCKSSRRGEAMVIALMQAGADPMSPHTSPEGRYSSSDPRPAVPLAQFLLDPMSLICSGLAHAPAAARAIFAAVSDEDLLRIGDEALRESGEGTLAKACSLPRGVGASALSEACARHEALREKAALESAAPKANATSKRPGF